MSLPLTSKIENLDLKNSYLIRFSVDFSTKPLNRIFMMNIKKYLYITLIFNKFITISICVKKFQASNNTYS